MIILLYNVVLNVLNKKQKNEVNAKAEFTTLAKRTTSFTSIANITLFAQAIGKLPKENIRKIIREEKTDKHCGNEPQQVDKKNYTLKMKK